DGSRPVRLHPGSRCLLMGFEWGPGRSAASLLRSLDAEWAGLHQLQRLSRLAHADHDKRHDVLSCAAHHGKPGARTLQSLLDANPSPDARRVGRSLLAVLAT